METTISTQMPRRVYLAGVGGLVSTGGAGCLGQSTESTAGDTIEDALGRTVQLPESISDLVAIGPGMLNLVVYLDAVDMVAGVEQTEHTWGKDLPYNMANPTLQDKPVIGPHREGDAELIADIDPDVIIANYLTQEVATTLETQTNIPVVTIRVSSRPGLRFDALYDDLKLLGEILEREQEATEVIGSFNAYIDELKTLGQESTETERSAYIAGRSASGGASIQSTQAPFAPFSLTNVQNVASNEVEGHAKVASEYLITWDPEIIFISGSNLSRVKDDLSQYSTLYAVENQSLYSLLPSRFYGDLFCNMLINAYYVGTVVYPTVFDDISIKDRANNIYSTILGADLYAEIKETFNGVEQVSV